LLTCLRKQLILKDNEMINVQNLIQGLEILSKYDKDINCYVTYDVLYTLYDNFYGISEEDRAKLYDLNWGFNQIYKWFISEYNYND